MSRAAAAVDTRRSGAPLAAALIAALCILLGSLLIFAASISGKWLLLSIAVFLAIVVWCAVPDQRLFAVTLLAAAAPLGVQYGLWSHGNRYYTFQHFGGAPPEPVINLVDGAIVLLAIMWCHDLAVGRRALPRWTRLDTLVVVFLLLSTLSVCGATEHLLLTFEVLRYLKYVLLFWILRSYLDRPACLWWILAASLAVAVFQGLVALAQYLYYFTVPVPVGGVAESSFEIYGGEVIQRVTGLLGHSNTFAAYLLLPIGFALSILAARVRWRWRLAVLPALAMSLLALLLTYSRNGLLTLALLVLLVLGVALATRRLPRLSLGYAGVAGLVVALLVLGFGFDLAARRALRLTGQGGQEGLLGSVVTRITYDPGKAVESRWDLMLIAAEMVRQHPLTGIGLNSFEENMARYDRTGTVNIIQQPVHNIYLLVAAESGIPSLIVFVAIGLWLLRRALRLLREPLEPAFVAGLVGLCALFALGFSNLFDLTMRKEPLVGMLTLVAALLMAAPSWTGDTRAEAAQKAAL